MSFGGILAKALAGGAGVIGKQAGDDIADQRKADLLKQQADIEFQTQQRLAEMRQRLDRDQTLWKTQGEGGTATLDFNRRDIEQRNDLAISQARNMIPVAVEQATAVAGAQRDAVTKSGSDPAYIKALRAISAANAAPDRTDYKGRELDNAIKQMGLDNAKRVQELKAEFGKAPPERQQQIKDELSILTGKDADKFVPVPLKDADGAISGYQVFDTKAGRFVDAGSGKGGSDPIKAAMDAARAEAAAKKQAPAKAPMIQTGAQQVDDATRYKLMSDGSGRMVDVTTGRTLTPEQSAILQKMQRGEPTTPRERAMLKG